MKSKAKITLSRREVIEIIETALEDRVNGEIESIDFHWAHKDDLRAELTLAIINLRETEYDL